ncbi:MAG: CpsD/CapB family tyrosine-protein kinase [Bryobacteraceae bacterium]
MSRVHDALRRAANESDRHKRPLAPVAVPSEQIPDLLSEIPEIPYTPAPGVFLIEPSRPSDAHSEEFRTLRTRLNHLQKLQPIHTVVVTSSCPAEGKSFTAVNLALAEAQLKDNPTLLADFDFRRPVLHNTFQFDRVPGATDVLLGKAQLSEAIRRIEGTNLYLMPAGSPVLNPLEILNLPETKALLDQLRLVFNWVLLDTPPLLFAADANLLATVTDGTILVVRLGVTTIDSVTRALQSLCENNVLGIVANGARAGELYSKYTYYYSGYYYREKKETTEDAEPA